MRIRRPANRLLPLFGAVVAVSAALAYALLPGGSGGASAEVHIGAIDDWPAQTGKAAPDFALVDAHDGTTVRSLSDYRGKTVVLNWYASWCGPCRAELPEFEEAFIDFGGDVVILAVNLQESRAAAESILKDAGATFPAVLDSTGDIARQYGVRGMPTTFFIDGEGVIRAARAGQLTEARLGDELASLGHFRDGGTP